jgi:hypothetical protein
MLDQTDPYRKRAGLETRRVFQTILEHPVWRPQGLSGTEVGHEAQAEIPQSFQRARVAKITS